MNADTISSGRIPSFVDVLTHQSELKMAMCTHPRRTSWYTPPQRNHHGTPPQTQKHSPIHPLQDPSEKPYRGGGRGACHEHVGLYSFHHDRAVCQGDTAPESPCFEPCGVRAASGIYAGGPAALA